MRGLRERTQSTTTERWLADRYRLSTPDARARVEQSHVFVRHPRLTDALTDGAVTVEQAAVIAKALDEVADLPLVEDVRARPGRRVPGRAGRRPWSRGTWPGPGRRSWKP